MEVEEAHVAQVRISLVGSDGTRVEGGGSQHQPPPPSSDWGYLTNLRAVAEAVPPAVAEATAEASASVSPGTGRYAVS